jgi:hypothetical protein
VVVQLLRSKMAQQQQQQQQQQDGGPDGVGGEGHRASGLVGLVSHPRLAGNETEHVACYLPLRGGASPTVFFSCPQVCDPCILDLTDLEREGVRVLAAAAAAAAFNR